MNPHSESDIKEATRGGGVVRQNSKWHTKMKHWDHCIVLHCTTFTSERNTSQKFPDSERPSSLESFLALREK